MIANIFPIFNVLLLLFVWIYPAMFYSELPNIIPIHFDGKGDTDGFGAKYMVWVEAALATVLFGICFFIYRKPQIINLPEDMKSGLQAVRNFIQIFCFVIMLAFALVMYYGVEISMGRSEGFSIPPGLIIGFIYLTIICLLIYLGKANQKKTKDV